VLLRPLVGIIGDVAWVVRHSWKRLPRSTLAWLSGSGWRANRGSLARLCGQWSRTCVARKGRERAAWGVGLYLGFSIHPFFVLWLLIESCVRLCISTGGAWVAQRTWRIGVHAVFVCWLLCRHLLIV
jgi:hypothetical protein